MKPLRIVLADDHEVVRRGLRALIESKPGWNVVGEAANGRDAVARVKELKPDIVVLDISMPELNGLDATRQIVKALPGVHVLILTMHDSGQLVRDVLEAGARGYVLKSDAGRDFITAVDTLRQNKPFFTPGVAELVLQGYLKGTPAAEAPVTPSELLTPREREIVQLLAEGKSNKEVATALGVSIKTAETHRANIMRKLNLHSLSDLVRYAIRNKIVEA